MRRKNQQGIYKYFDHTPFDEHNIFNDSVFLKKSDGNGCEVIKILTPKMPYSVRFMGDVVAYVAFVRGTGGVTLAYVVFERVAELTHKGYKTKMVSEFTSIESFDAKSIVTKTELVFPKL